MVHLKIRDCARASDLVLDIWIQTCWVQGSWLGIELRKRPFDEPSRSQSKLANMFSTRVLENKGNKNNTEQHLWYSNLYMYVYIYIYAHLSKSQTLSLRSATQNLLIYTPGNRDLILHPVALWIAACRG